MDLTVVFSEGGVWFMNGGKRWRNCNFYKWKLLTGWERLRPFLNAFWWRRTLDLDLVSGFFDGVGKLQGSKCLRFWDFFLKGSSVSDLKDFLMRASNFRKINCSVLQIHGIQDNIEFLSSEVKVSRLTNFRASNIKDSNYWQSTDFKLRISHF